MTEALQSSEKEQWKAALRKEMNQFRLTKCGTSLPANREPVGSKWVFKRKIKADE